MSTESLLGQYYANLKNPESLSGLLADDFRFVGGDMTKPDALVGRDAYVAVLRRLSTRFTQAKVERMFVDRDHAAVVARYDWTFPKTGVVPGSVAEIWTVRNERLQSLTIFFDTLSFDRLSRG